jgi:hypothetical protein
MNAKTTKATAKPVVVNLTDAIVAQITAIAAEGKSAKQIRGFLAFEHSLEGKAATELMEKAGVSAGGKAGSFESIVTWLGAEPRTEDALYEHILFNGTVNEARWISQRNTIRKTINRVFASGGKNITEVAASVVVKAAVKAMYPK